MAYQHILVALDLLPENNDLIDKVAELAKAFKAKVSLLHVVPSLTNYGYVGINQLEDDMVAEAKQSLAKIGKVLSVAPEDQWVAVGSPRREIVESAKDLKVDLLVLGSHSHSALGDLLGSTTNGVLHHANCDVLTFRCHHK